MADGEGEGVARIINTTIVILLISLWLTCWIVDIGLILAHDRGSHPSLFNYREDLGWAMAIGLLYSVIGPIGTFVLLMVTGFGQYGWMVLPPR